MSVGQEKRFLSFVSFIFQMKWTETSLAVIYITVFSCFGVHFNIGFILSSILDYILYASIRRKQIPLSFPSFSGNPRFTFDFREENYLTEVNVGVNCS